MYHIYFILLSGNECRALNDDRDPCVFPFYYGNKLYNQCTDVDETYFWCATEVDESLQVIEWEQCGEECPKGMSSLAMTWMNKLSKKTIEHKTVVFLGHAI